MLMLPLCPIKTVGHGQHNLDKGVANNMVKKMVCILCVAALTLSAQVAYDQSAATPPPSDPAILSVETKPATPPRDKWEFEIVPYLWMAAMKGDVTIKGIECSL